MSVIEILNEFMEESARTLQSPFTIEKQAMTGSIVVWNIPDTIIDTLKTAIQNEVKAENVDAIRKLVSNNIHPEESVYTIAMQSAKAADNRSNLRFNMQYAGPKLQKKISGIHTTKDQVSAWLHKAIKTHVDRVKLTAQASNGVVGKVDKPVDISHQSRYLKFVAKHTSHEMVFKITPNKKEYGAIAIRNMPHTIENIVIYPVRIKGTEATYRMNAAGLPWLVRIAKILDVAIHSEVGR